MKKKLFCLFVSISFITLMNGMEDEAKYPENEKPLLRWVYPKTSITFPYADYNNEDELIQDIQEMTDEDLGDAINEDYAKKEPFLKYEMDEACQRIMKNKTKYSDTKSPFGLTGQSFLLLLDTLAKKCNPEFWKTAYQTISITHEKNIPSTMQFSPDSKIIAIGYKNGLVQAWTRSTRAKIELTKEHNRPIDAIAFSDDSKILAASSTDNTNRIWNIEKGECIDPFLNSHDYQMALSSLIAFKSKTKYAIPTICMSPNQEILVFANKNLIELTNVKNVKFLKTLEAESPVTSIIFSPDSQSFATLSENHVVHIWQKSNIFPSVQELLQAIP